MISQEKLMTSLTNLITFFSKISYLIKTVVVKMNKYQEDAPFDVFWYRILDKASSDGWFI